MKKLLLAALCFITTIAVAQVQYGNKADVTFATQNITTQDLVSSSASGMNSQSIITGTPTAGSAASFAISNAASIKVQVTGTWTGTLIPEVSFDGGTTWYATGLHQTGTAYTAGSFTANFGGGLNVSGATNFRMRATAAVTGTAIVKVIQSFNSNSIYVANGINIQDANTQSQKLNVSASGAAKVDGSAVTQPVSGTFWQSTQPVSIADATASISISANATSGGSITTLNGQTGAVIQLTGTFTATAQIQITTDGSTWLNITGSNSIINGQTGAYMASGNLTATGIYGVNIAGLAGIRIITTAYTSGTITGTVRASFGTVIAGTAASPSVTIASGTVTTVTTVTTVSTVTTLSQFAASAAAADATANITSTAVRSFGHLWNGSSWDRQYGVGFNTTTGDAGAKTATGNGATQTNTGYKGVNLFIVLGTVSGTTPTCVFKLQGSVDGSTNWYDIPGATTASLTASTNVGIQAYPGLPTLAGSTTTGTTATISAVLPRTWRVVWTIGGTTPSFTITSISYNAIP